MKKRFSIIFLLTMISVQAQIKGNFKLLAGQKLELIGYNNFKTEILSITNVDRLGDFNLIYPNTYKGMAILKAKDKSSLAFILTETGLKITGLNLRNKDSLLFSNTNENNIFITYFQDYKQRQSVLSAWYYLKDKYQKEDVLKNKESVLKNINDELISIENEDVKYLQKIDKQAYVSWFLPLKKLVSEMPIIEKYHKNKIPKSINQFRSIDFKNPKFKTSGLLKDLINGHYKLLENMGQPIDSIYYQMNKSTDYLLDNLVKNESLLNLTSEYLFEYLEKRSLFKSSEYLAVKLLSQNSCGLDETLTNKLEAYRKLKVGNTAPDIVFSDETKLSNIISTKLLVFGASWCPKCKDDALKLKDYYNSWKEKGMHVVYISIDTNKTDFEKIYTNSPWKTDCTFLGWKTKAVKDYHVFATPTYFLLDNNLKIVLRPKSVEQVNSWIQSKFEAN